jgi:PTS system nitrogen regulatory IIA component
MDLGRLASIWSQRARIPHPKAQSIVNAIASLLGTEDILLNLDVEDKSELFEIVGWHMQQKHAMPQDWVAQSLMRRERLGSTGLGAGVAIPHARVKNLDHIQVAFARLKSPVPFNSPDGKPVSDALFLLVPKQATEEHLKILAVASEMFSDKRFRDRLYSCSDPIGVKREFDAWPDTPA